MYIIVVKFHSGSVQVNDTNSEGEMLDTVRIYTGSLFVESVRVTHL